MPKVESFINLKAMKKLLSSLLVLTLFFVYSPSSHAQMDPKVKTVAIMAGYGTVGGAMLGLASLAFRSSPRAIPVGASLGLYAGLLFGSYIVVTHEMRKRGMYQEDNYYPDAPSTPYDNGGGSESTPYDNTDNNSNDGAYRWDPYQLQNEYAWNSSRLEKKSSQGQEYYVNFLTYQF